MQTKRVKCPHCGVVLDVKNSKNETIKQITCPQCMNPLQVRFDPAEEPLAAQTFYAPKQKQDNAATQLGNINGAKILASSSKSKKAILTFQGEDYPLCEGQNIIGRSGNTSKATIQIKSDDRYMSRQHIAIEITTLSDGTIKAVMSNYQNKNATTVDGQEIETGDAIRLTNGNSITMGHTTVIFKLS